MDDSIDFERIPPLRPLEAVPAEGDGAGGMIALVDPARITDGVMTVSAGAFVILTLLDREKSLETVIAEAREKYKFEPKPDEVKALIRQVDEAALLNNGRFSRIMEDARKQFLEAPARKAMFAGKSYTEDGPTLSGEISSLLETEPVIKDTQKIKAIVTPHIDYRVGADLMAKGWREIAECDADLFIILGVGHALSDDFVACLDKDYETPLGAIKTDKEFLKSLGKRFGEDIYHQAEAHKNEHSIEFASIFMANVFSHREVSAVPILLSFPENIWDMDHSRFNGERLERFIKSLRETAESCGKKVMYVASVDFAHVGARFGDLSPLTDHKLEEVEKTDKKLMESITAMDGGAFLATIQETNQKNRVCGFPALYTLMKVCGATSGQELGYRQNIEGERDSMVSFGALALY